MAGRSVLGLRRLILASVSLSTVHWNRTDRLEPWISSDLIRSRVSTDDPELVTVNRHSHSISTPNHVAAPVLLHQDRTLSTRAECLQSARTVQLESCSHGEE